jgi:hypothetical protein
MTTYWVSFATKEKFVGVAIVDVDVDDKEFSDAEMATAIIEETIRRGCNGGPHTSVRMMKLPANRHIPDSLKNRLLSKDEIDAKFQAN